MQIVRHLDEEVWRDFVERNPRGNIFHTPEMYLVFSRARGCRPSLWAAIRNDGTVLALLLPVHVTLSDGPLSLVTTRALAYGSVLVDPSTEGEAALSSLLQTYNKQVSALPLFTELRNLSDLSDSQAVLLENGFIYEEHLNYLIDLNRSPEAIFQSIGQRTRKNIRRSLRLGEISVEEVGKREQVATCYDLLCQTYHASRVPLADRSLFESAFDVLYPKRMIRFTLASLDQTPVATSIELVYKDVVYGWYGGLDRTFASYMPNEIMTWHILQWGAENGYSVYDFGGAGKPYQKYGVRDFKAKFGGKLVNFGRNTCIHAPVRLRMSQAGYQVLRKFL